MSLLRILIALPIGIVTFSGTIAIAQYFQIHLALAALAWCVTASLVFDLYLRKKSQQALAPYLRRKCTGLLWKRRFPKAQKAAIRQFLDTFILAFVFPNRQLCFSPDDRIMDIYCAAHPDRTAPDNCELETLVELCRERYGVDIVPSWNEDLTLGELYALVTSP